MIVAVILFALLVALLAIPFDIKFDIRRHDKFHSDIAVQWMFGIVKLKIPGQRQRKPDIKPPTARKTKKTKNKRANVRVTKNLLWNARFRYRFFKFVKDMINTVHIAGFYLRLKLGLDDPADTGRLWAFLGPLAVFISGISNATVTLQPDFQSQIFYLDSSGRIRIVPLQVIFTVFTFVFSPITISAIWTTFAASRK